MNPVPPAYPFRTPATTFLFRFFTIYLVLYIFPFPLNEIPGLKIVFQLYDAGWVSLINLVGRTFFHTTQPITYLSDGIYSYLQVLILTFISLAGAIGWTVLSRKKSINENIVYGITALVRYYLGLTMLGYGLSKVFNVQFQGSDYYYSLSLGEVDPMTLLWNFMDYSYGYNLFTGMVEVLGGILLFFRKTTLLGALMLVSALINVVLLNFCFDVYVKLFSSHLLVMAVFLVAFNTGPLFKLFFKQQAASFYQPAFPSIDPRYQKLIPFAKAIIIGLFFYQQLTMAYNNHMKYGEGAPSSALAGNYTVDSFRINQHLYPQLMTDSVRWKTILLSGLHFAAVRTMNGQEHTYSFYEDTVANQLLFKYWADTIEMPQGILTYEQPDSLHLNLSGTWQSDSIFISMRRIEYNLLSHKTKWLNE